MDLCNQLIGSQIEKLTAEDLYVLLMGALFHDVGMGVSVSDFEQFRKVLGFPEPADDNARAWAVRDHHQELSGLYLEKYWRMLDFPNEAYAKAVIQVCRGHRKTDLMDTEGYPPQFEVEPGKAVSLPYLAALRCAAGWRQSDLLLLSRKRMCYCVWRSRRRRNHESIGPSALPDGPWMNSGCGFLHTRPGFANNIPEVSFMDPKDRKARETEAPIPPGIYPVIDTDLARDNIENDLPAADREDLRETSHPRSVRADAAALDHGKPTER